MVGLHLLAGLVLILATVGCSIHAMTSSPSSGKEERNERLALYGFVIGLPWAAVLFTGFFQLGSMMDLSETAVAKFAVTLIGGIGGMAALMFRASGLLTRSLLAGILLGAAVLFSLSGYWGFLS